MKHSSRQDPCPVCGRNKDDKCRWSNEFILCYDGNSFSPPGHLVIGDRIKVDHQSYALCSRSSGFAGNSYCFALVDDFNYRFLNYEDKILYRRQCVKITRTFLSRHLTALEIIKDIANEDKFYDMNGDEFYLNKNNAKKLIPFLSELIEYATANKRYIVDYVEQIKQLIEAVKALKQTLNCIYGFERDFLGAIDPSQGDMRGHQEPLEGAQEMQRVGRDHLTAQRPCIAAEPLPVLHARLIRGADAKQA